MSDLGSRAIDGRSSVGVALRRWKADLAQDLGGDDSISTQQETLIELAVRSKIMLDSIDACLLAQPSLINACKRTLIPLVLQRQTLADGLARYLSQLGLERRRQFKTLQDLRTADPNTDKPATVNGERHGRLMETTALTTSNAETEATTSAAPRTFARTALTHVQNDSGRVRIPSVISKGR